MGNRARCRAATMHNSTNSISAKARRTVRRETSPKAAGPSWCIIPSAATIPASSQPAAQRSPPNSRACSVDERFHSTNIPTGS